MTGLVMVQWQLNIAAGAGLPACRLTVRPPRFAVRAAACRAVILCPAPPPPRPMPCLCRAGAVRLVSLRTLPPPRCPVRLYRAGRRAMPCRCRQGGRIAVRPYELPPYPVRLADLARQVISPPLAGLPMSIKRGQTF
jgi:hypothetical protein